MVQDVEQLAKEIGRGVTASEFYATALGVLSTASGTSSLAAGDGPTASGAASVALGNYTQAPSFAETVIGTYNETYTPNNTSDWDAADRLFTIGNGTSSTPSNAMVVLKSGNTGLGTSTPDTTFHLVGKMKYQDGTQASGYVLTSDANGNATWEEPTETTYTAGTGLDLNGTVFSVNSNVVISNYGGSSGCA